MISEISSKLKERDRKVLHHIWRKGPIPRQDIAEELGASAMAISRATKNLTDLGLIVDEVHHSGVAGNPTRPLSINPNAAYSIGINFTNTQIEAGIIDLSGSLIFHQTTKTESVTLETIIETINGLFTSTEVSAKIKHIERKTLGVGISFPGDFSEKRQLLSAYPIFKHFTGRDLFDEISAHVELPIFMNSDSNCAAIGEFLLGAGRNFRNFFMVYLGYGVGGGLIINDRPYTGEHDNAGIIGIFWPTDKPRPSGLDYIDMLKGNGIDVKDFSDLAETDMMEHHITKTWIRRSGQQLREVLRYVARLLDPAAIIIGGRLPNDMHHAIALEIDSFEQSNMSTLEAQAKQPRIIGSMIGAKASVVGAAALPIYSNLIDSE